MSAMTEFRVDRDTMGEIQVPKAAKYRAQTQRAVENFPISGTPLEAAQIAALARIKAAAATVNAELGVVDDDSRGHSVADGGCGWGRWNGESRSTFPKTFRHQRNMKQERKVLATLASERPGPRESTRTSRERQPVEQRSFQSSITSGRLTPRERPDPGEQHLEGQSPTERPRSFAEPYQVRAEKHMMDATPVTLGRSRRLWRRKWRMASNGC